MKSQAILSYVITGLPGGCLILMGMLLFNALLSEVTPVGQWTRLLLLCLTALTVGLLARWTRPYHGLGTAVVAGLVAAGFILFLWLSAAPGSQAEVVFGPLGMLAAAVFSTLGGWILPRLKKSKR
ncbi:MAG: hypothetical protein ABWK53_09880 [Anaerolineales bacterium]